MHLRRSLLALAAGTALLLAACGSSGGSDGATTTAASDTEGATTTEAPLQGEITVSAAASLTEAFSPVRPDRRVTPCSASGLPKALRDKARATVPLGTSTVTWEARYVIPAEEWSHEAFITSVGAPFTRKCLWMPFSPTGSGPSAR